MPEELGDLYIRTRREGDLFNLRHLKAKNKNAGTTDPRAALCVTHSLQAMQDLLTAFPEVSKRFGLTINIKKTSRKQKF